MKDKMKVARYYGAGDIRIEEMPLPVADGGEVVVRIRASGICGSDVMHWYRAGRGPTVLGHEVAGEIESVGKGVETWKKGDRVVAAHHVPCNTCHYCRSGHHTVCDTLRKTNFHPGGFSEYVRIPRINVDRGLFLVPDGLSFEEATFVEPLACVLRGQKAAGASLGKSVLVIGSGISGLLHIKLAKSMGCRPVVAVDISKPRLDIALKAGADAVIGASEDIPASFRRFNQNRASDIVILTAGASSAIEAAFRSVDRGGTVLFFAPASHGASVSLPVNDLFWRNEITLTSSYAANHEEHAAAMEMLRQRRVDVRDMITHRLPLERTAEGFALVEEARDSLKVIIEP